MSQFDITYPSQDDKTITALVSPPPTINAETGLLLVVHGWSNNRFQYAQDMVDYAQRFNLVCVSPEYRLCGFDHDPAGGKGTTLPYDYSHDQVIDALNAIPAALLRYPALNRRRIMGWGGSQGGHIILLCAVFAPLSFACVVDMCGLTHATDERLAISGRSDMPQAERDIRNVHLWVGRIRSRMLLVHGTADPIVDWHMTARLEQDMQAAGVDVTAHFVPDADHMLKPVTSRYEQTLLLASSSFLSARRSGPTEFDLRRQYRFPCTGRDYVLDYSTGWARWLQ